MTSRPYWTAPGGVDPEDSSAAAALRRELAEEFGASVQNCEQVFLFSAPAGDGGVSVQRFFACRLGGLDTSARTGEEFVDPQRGGYHLDYVDLSGDSLAEVSLEPTALKVVHPG